MNRKISVDLPEPLLRRFRSYAAERNRSMSQLLIEALEKLMGDEETKDLGRLRFLRRIQNAPTRGTRGAITWSRADLHRG